MCAVSLHAWPAMGQRAVVPASGGPEERIISVSGEAEVRVVPDEVVITLGVETYDADLNAAKADNDTRVAAILAAARVRRIPDNLVRTDFMQLEPRYRSQTDAVVHKGYVVRKTIVITLRDVSAFDDVLTATVAAGATHIHGIDFRTRELRAHRDRARSLAVDAAREKAQAMAERLGARVGPPLTINEGRSGWSSGYGGGWGARFSNMSSNVVQNVGGGESVGGGGESVGDGTISPGQISVRGSVTVTFELIR
jgi:uncharacterized protein YggE